MSWFSLLRRVGEQSWLGSKLSATWRGPFDEEEASADSVSSVHLQAYKPRDLVSLVALDAECFAPTFRFSTSAMRHFAEAENAWTRLALDGEELVGFCIVHLEQGARGACGVSGNNRCRRQPRSSGHRQQYAGSGRGMVDRVRCLRDDAARLREEHGGDPLLQACRIYAGG